MMVHSYGGALREFAERMEQQRGPGPDDQLIPRRELQAMVVALWARLHALEGEVARLQSRVRAVPDAAQGRLEL